MTVDAVIVTKGDVNLYPIRQTLSHFEKVVVWDNSKGPNMGPFGQFLAATYLCSSRLVYFQDDDCTTSPDSIVSAWEPGKIVCNMGCEGHEKNYVNRKDKLMGFGSCFERELIKPTFEEFWKHYPIDYVTWREPGRIFTAMNHESIKVVNVPVCNLPWATDSDRLYRQADHISMKDSAVARVEKVLCSRL